MANMTRGNWAEAIAPGLVEYAYNQYNEYAPLYPRITRVMDTDRAYDEVVNAAGLGDYAEESEGSATAKDAMLEGYKTRYTALKFRKGVNVTRELNDDGQYGSMND